MRVIYGVPIVSAAEVATEQIPKNQGKVPLETASRKEKLIEAGILLMSMFDQAMVRTNRARERAGWAADVRLRQPRDGTRCYYTPAPHGGERKLVLFIALPLRDGEIFGGAYIKPSGARTAVYVVPVIDVEPSRWLIQASEAELTPAVVDDLFRSTFSDDADAVARLAPHYGFDLFTTPWS
jgi:hypothetical protein